MISRATTGRNAETVYVSIKMVVEVEMTDERSSLDILTEMMDESDEVVLIYDL